MTQGSLWGFDVKGDEMVLKLTALLICASWFLPACLPPFSASPTDNTSHAHCQMAAHYIANQYATSRNASLPVEPNSTVAYSDVILREEVSVYDVIYQHKGFDAVIKACLAHHDKS